MTRTAPKFLGISDEITNCDCCGKSNLKRTVALDFEGDTQYFGVNCAARALGLSGRYTAKDAGRLASDVTARDEARAKMARVKASATAEAAKCGEPVHVCRSQRHGLYTVRDSAMVSASYLHSFPVFTAMPQVVRHG